MSNEYTNNHYVPQWYQKRFLVPGQLDQKLYYLDLAPPSGSLQPPVARRPIKRCFAIDDLYSLRLGDQKSTDIERLFFGAIDSKGHKAVSYWENFTHPSVDYTGFKDIVGYMSTQKLRTPKGLDWLSTQVNSDDSNKILQKMVQMRDLYCAIWTECIWQIADATSSETKFIVSDHPVTVYNRECGPRNKKWCRGARDPDIHLNGTHTIFPLSLNKVLILTNLSWARHPYQSAVGSRPNAEYLRGAVFNFTAVQTLRSLNEQEVREINFIIKSRAYKHVGAAKEEWLHPENFVSKSDWNTFGDGYLLMPDPRAISYGGEIVIGYKDGSSDAFDAFGRKPWQAGYGQDDTTHAGKYDPLERFKGEFAKRFGPYRRGRSFNLGELEDEKDSESYHKYHLGLAKK